jgi:hypothetical protein
MTTQNFRCHAELSYQNKGRESDGWLVEIVWDSPKVDRPNTGGKLFGPTARDKQLAERYVRCVNDQKAFDVGEAEVCTDIAGKTFVSAESTIYHRHANACLRRLGY